MKAAIAGWEFCLTHPGLLGRPVQLQQTTESPLPNERKRSTQYGHTLSVTELGASKQFTDIRTDLQVSALCAVLRTTQLEPSLGSTARSDMRAQPAQALQGAQAVWHLASNHRDPSATIASVQHTVAHQLHVPDPPCHPPDTHHTPSPPLPPAAALPRCTAASADPSMTVPARQHQLSDMDM